MYTYVHISEFPMIYTVAQVFLGSFLLCVGLRQSSAPSLQELKLQQTPTSWNMDVG